MIVLTHLPLSPSPIPPTFSAVNTLPTAGVSSESSWHAVVSTSSLPISELIHKFTQTMNAQLLAIRDNLIGLHSDINKVRS